MKTFWVALIVVFVAFLIPQSAQALEDWCDAEQVGDTMCDWMNDTWGGTSGGGGGGGTTSTLCTKDYCPRCALNASQTGSICYTLFSQSGYCTCSASNEVFTDRYGGKWPRCNTSGSCRYRR